MDFDQVFDMPVLSTDENLSDHAGNHHLLHLCLSHNPHSADTHQITQHDSYQLSSWQTRQKSYCQIVQRIDLQSVCGHVC